MRDGTGFQKNLPKTEFDDSQIKVLYLSHMTSKFKKD